MILTFKSLEQIHSILKEFKSKWLIKEMGNLSREYLIRKNIREVKYIIRKECWFEVGGILRR